MSVWTAVFWGGLTSAALFLGQWLAGPMAPNRRLTGLVMGFGAGTLLSAVAYELVPESIVDDGAAVAAAFLLGAVVYYVGDREIDRRGGADRQVLPRPGAIGDGAADSADDSDDSDDDGSGLAMFLGALLDGVPEAFILGLGLAVGGSISVAFVVAVFVSNVPQGVAGTASLKAAGYTDRHVFGMWSGLTVACAVVAGLGFVLADSIPDQGVEASAFAGGAVLAMLADSMMPEAFRHGGPAVGLLTVAGYLVAAVLSVAS